MVQGLPSYRLTGCTANGGGGNGAVVASILGGVGMFGVGVVANGGTLSGTPWLVMVGVGSEGVLVVGGSRRIPDGEDMGGGMRVGLVTKVLR